GTTAHGGQKMLDDNGVKFAEPQPIMYYGPQGPMARAFDIARAARSAVARSAAGQTLNYGVVGLGGGSLACFVKPGESMTFFEIDPVVASIATDTSHFTFLSHCAPAAKIVLGDARLTLAKEPGGRFDFLVIDAFSSDAVPVHLLTREAIELYLSRLTDGGLLAFHISNRHMELESVVAATAAGVPGLHMATIYKEDSKRTLDEFPSHVVYMSKDPSVIERAMKSVPGAREVRRGTTLPWSDNYADVLSAIWRRYTE
ncbi:MAG: fused MFS/spermidine synthase, partial [Alphaproteobacteria bacterium]|nr:fused MFS/spermidine synthase [Alphaproteobacteria bacterium]